MAYRAQTSPVIRFTNLGFVVLLHVVLIYGLVQMLARTEIPHLLQSIKTTIIEEVQVANEEAPPPPPALEKPPPVYVPPPEIAIETTTTSGAAIQAVTSDRIWPKGRATNVRPPYPPASQRLREEGVVTLALYVDVTGRVTEGKVEKSSGHPLLDEAALNTALGSWRFTPGKLEGQPAAMWFKVNVQFRCFDPVTRKDACG
jgi:protein TonB